MKWEEHFGNENYWLALCVGSVSAIIIIDSVLMRTISECRSAAAVY